MMSDATDMQNISVKQVYVLTYSHHFRLSSISTASCSQCIFFCRNTGSLNPKKKKKNLKKYFLDQSIQTIFYLNLKTEVLVAELESHSNPPCIKYLCKSAIRISRARFAAYTRGRFASGVVASVAVLTEITLRSPPKIFIFIIKKIGRAHV